MNTDKQQKQLLYQNSLGNRCQYLVSLAEQMDLGMSQFSGITQMITGMLLLQARTMSWTRNQKNVFPAEGNGGKLVAIYANKADGITKNCYVPRPSAAQLMSRSQQL
jgi:hypothetical protein